MSAEPDLACPKCGNTMELLTADDESLTRVCLVCGTLAWNAADGAVEIREGQKLTEEEKRELSANDTSTTVEEELARLRELEKPQ